MNNTTITIILPSLLRKIKPYQNLSLIISALSIIIASLLSLFEHSILSKLMGYFVLFSLINMILFVILSLPYLFKKTDIAVIKDGVLHINTYRKSLKVETNDVILSLNTDKNSLKDDQTLIKKTGEKLPIWGNYIIIPHKNICIDFIPSEDLLKLSPPLKIGYRKSRSILMNNTIDLLKKIFWMLWSTSS